MFIGDSYRNDIMGALNVNMAAIWLTNSDKDTELNVKDGLNQGIINFKKLNVCKY